MQYQSLPSMPSSIKAGMLLSALISGSAALPSSSASLALTEAAGTGSATIVWLSKVAPTIFGQDATSFDYFLHSEPTLAKEAIGTYAQVHSAATSNEDDLVKAFLNATLAGTLTHEQASDNAWRCAELGHAMASSVKSCQGLAEVTGEHSGVSERDLVARSRYKWIQKAAHISSSFAMNALAGVFGNMMYNNLPQSPRSSCNTAGGTNACFSWSQVEATFNEAYARSFVEDALSVVDFNKYSAQSNGVLTRKRAAADVCLSNRATGCT